jgi:hypothetical protein
VIDLDCYFVLCLCSYCCHLHRCLCLGQSAVLDFDKCSIVGRILLGMHVGKVLSGNIEKMDYRLDLDHDHIERLLFPLVSVRI